MSEPWHGTIGGYTNHYCRCADCREANRVSRMRRRHERYRETPPNSVRHGSRHTYSNWGCRCSPCRAAHVDYMRAWKASRSLARKAS